LIPKSNVVLTIHSISQSISSYGDILSPTLIKVQSAVPQSDVTTSIQIIKQRGISKSDIVLTKEGTENGKFDIPFFVTFLQRLIPKVGIMRAIVRLEETHKEEIEYA